VRFFLESSAILTEQDVVGGEALDSCFPTHRLPWGR